MRRLVLLVTASIFVLSACSNARNGFRNADEVAFIGNAHKPLPDLNTDPEGLLKRYTVEFEIPNPLMDQGFSSPRLSDPNHEGLIYCSAVLLDSLATEADIAASCRKDSLDMTACEAFRIKYLADHVRKDRFRIRIAMESGFSEKSLDPKQWVIRLITTKGVEIEPVSITTTPAITASDSIYSSFHRMSLPRKLIRSDIILTFNRVTFFGEDLLGLENPHLSLEIIREQKTVARVAWSRGEKKP